MKSYSILLSLVFYSQREENCAQPERVRIKFTFTPGNTDIKTQADSTTQ